ncbi:hypothetical protein TeGR_g8080 [Tetraparma gracilis]|uniref:Uncharacterized protein n=1 Tax=Tetraparma gracilis TaxID=2962635 RepID=A0ABQ6M8H0_9STRA|nr:hypothetical protein TeGR_g8080 [Tetraparma gracilis]
MAHNETRNGKAPCVGPLKTTIRNLAKDHTSASKLSAIEYLLQQLNSSNLTKFGLATHPDFAYQLVHPLGCDTARDTLDSKVLHRRLVLLRTVMMDETALDALMTQIEVMDIMVRIVDCGAWTSDTRDEVAEIVGLILTSKHADTLDNVCIAVTSVLLESNRDLLGNEYLKSTNRGFERMETVCRCIRRFAETRELAEELLCAESTVETGHPLAPILFEHMSRALTSGHARGAEARRDGFAIIERLANFSNDEQCQCIWENADISKALVHVIKGEPREGEEKNQDLACKTVLLLAETSDTCKGSIRHHKEMQSALLARVKCKIESSSGNIDDDWAFRAQRLTQPPNLDKIAPDSNRSALPLSTQLSSPPTPPKKVEAMKKNKEKKGSGKLKKRRKAEGGEAKVKKSRPESPPAPPPALPRSVTVEKKPEVKVENKLETYFGQQGAAKAKAKEAAERKEKVEQLKSSLLGQSPPKETNEDERVAALEANKWDIGGAFRSLLEIEPTQQTQPMDVEMESDGAGPGAESQSRPRKKRTGRTEKPLPPGWSSEVRGDPDKRTWKAFFGPNGETARSCAEAHRIASGTAAGGVAEEQGGVSSADTPDTGGGGELASAPPTEVNELTPEQQHQAVPPPAPVSKITAEGKARMEQKKQEAARKRKANAYKAKWSQHMSQASSSVSSTSLSPANE